MAKSQQIVPAREFGTFMGIWRDVAAGANHTFVASKFDVIVSARIYYLSSESKVNQMHSLRGLTNSD